MIIKIIFYILVGVFALLGIGILNTAKASLSKSFGLILGGLSYLGAAVIAYATSSWWPFVIGFGLAWGIRILGGEPKN
jgi:hypothetical protein